MNLLPGANNGTGAATRVEWRREWIGRRADASATQLDRRRGRERQRRLHRRHFQSEPQNAYVGVVPPIEGVQEVQVFAGKYDAEYGFSGSAVINVVTKSGSQRVARSGVRILEKQRERRAQLFRSDRSLRSGETSLEARIGGAIRKNKLFLLRGLPRHVVSARAPMSMRARRQRRCTKATSQSFTRLAPPSGSDSTYGQLYDPFSTNLSTATGMSPLLLRSPEILFPPTALILLPRK